ncbi:hypothetical protein WJX77_010907 [Trebouxia sp. C0004]
MTSSQAVVRFILPGRHCRFRSHRSFKPSSRASAGNIPDGMPPDQVQSGAPDLQDDNCSDDSDYLSASSNDVDSLCGR